MSSRVAELFGHSMAEVNPPGRWRDDVTEQRCPYLDRKCNKVRKSRPDTAIGTCTVTHGSKREPVMICTHRLLERRKIFVDSMHLLTLHEPGHELHILPEVHIPGGCVDYFLASVRGGKIRDFIGIELQTVDSTGTVWPERQRLLHSMGFVVESKDVTSGKTFGINWKMTAKTILVQLHHKIETFEHLQKHLVLVIQDRLLAYMQREFSFDHIANPARISDSIHLHGYALEAVNNRYELQLAARLSTDADGIERALGLKSDAKLELQAITRSLESRLSDRTRFSPV